MTTARRTTDFFVTGGALRPNAPSYVERPADDKLFELACAGEFAYVLTTRQMGKSSLMHRTARRLKKEGIRTVRIDLTNIGTVSVEKWYLGLLVKLTRQLRLEIDLEAWWQKHSWLGTVQRFSIFLHDVVLSQIQKPVVIFIDEIDVTLGLNFSDDFFAAIRSLYNTRAQDSAFERLTFVLLGVASPPDLIKDRTKTPFNIGQSVLLQDFSRHDAATLQAGLEKEYPEQGEAIFTRIYDWTDGHPYLTQKLCQEIVKGEEKSWTKGQINELVKKTFSKRESHDKDTNLQFVQDMIRASPERYSLLTLYRKVYEREVVREDERSLVQNQLKLFGLIRSQNGILKLRNEVYRYAFDSAWIAKLYTEMTTEFFVATGSLVSDTPSYVKRPADDQLLRLTLHGTFCYVLTARQMGKSSLMNRTADRLRELGVKTAIIELAQIYFVTIEQWYLGLLDQLARALELTVDLISWWEGHASVGYADRFFDFITNIFLMEIEDKIVIFFDEIETIINSNLRQENFFRAIRSMYNARIAQPQFQRLTFVFLGATSLTDLIKERTGTAFEIGQRITLEEFSLDEAIILQEGLEAIFPTQGEQILKDIYYWTNGHPYLTQQLCLSIVRSSQRRWTAKRVKKLVEELFLLSDATRKDTNLQVVQDFILNSPYRRQLLSLYQQLCQGEKVTDKQSNIHNQLKLSGLVKTENSFFTISNEIYKRVFNNNWVINKTGTNLQSISPSDFFAVGGTVRIDSPSYIKRPADDKLLKLVLAGKYCYVLTARQLGKSSLMIRTFSQLRSQGVKTAIIDLAQTGLHKITVDQWYLALLNQLQEHLLFREDPMTWWEIYANISPTFRFIQFLHNVILSEITGQIVIFIDEIDLILHFRFRDDYFAAIRTIYNARAHDPEYNRLTFVFLGVASPTELIEDPVRTPFNIASPITLGDFSLQDAAVLEENLDIVFRGKGKVIFERIYRWTNGHPYLTQKLCLGVVQDSIRQWDDERIIDGWVKELFQKKGNDKDDNIKWVENFILYDGQRNKLLRLYRKVCEGQKVADDSQSMIHNQLKLSGLVKVEDGYLHPRNRIYQMVFDLSWVKQHSESSSPRTIEDRFVSNNLSKNLRRITVALAILMILVLGASIMRWFG